MVTVTSLPITIERHLVHHLRDHRVDLAGHDAGAGLPGRQPQLPEAGLRAGGEQPEVVADLRDLHGGALEDSGELHEHPGVGGGLDQVGSADQRQAGDLGEMAADGFAIVRVRGDTGADRGRSEVDLAEQGA